MEIGLYTKALKMDHTIHKENSSFAYQVRNDEENGIFLHLLFDKRQRMVSAQKQKTLYELCEYTAHNMINKLYSNFIVNNYITNNYICAHLSI